MSDKIALNLQTRTETGRQSSQLLTRGLVPGVIYGHGVQPINVSAPEVPMSKAYHQAGRHHPLELTIGSSKHLAMIKAVDLDPVKRTLRHVSFQAVRQNEAVTTEVPVVIASEGSTPAERAGLVVLTVLDRIEVSALPADLPDKLEAPGDRLTTVGDHLTVADLVLPKGVTLHAEASQVIASVYEPSALVSEEAQDVTETSEEQTQEPSGLETAK